jgi:hypothetical protein
VAATLGIDPMPWQDTAATYATAKGRDDLWAYREIAVVVGRQNGKTTFTKPLIVARLRAGRSLMHIAQVRELPRIMFEAIADALEESDPDLFPRRRGKIIWPRRGAGSESIVLTNGGTYRIAAAIRGGSRGHSFDDLLIDELREMESFDVINAAKPAQRFSDDPQTIYLSNAGTDDSVVLNALRKRAGEDPSLAYLEWSADPSFDASDRRGWVQSNPAIGHFPQVLRDLEQDHTAAKLSGNMAGFETEALCRWVPSMRPRLVDEHAWLECQVSEVPTARRPAMGISMDPNGTRASVALAWKDGTDIYLRMLYDVPGSPVDIAALGEDLRAESRKHRVVEVGYDPMTDVELSKYFPKVKSLSGGKYANASSTFVNLIDQGQLHWIDCEAITDDLVWTSRKSHDEGAYEAVRANDDRPITAVLAAIRAVFLVSGYPQVIPKVY